jgi:hypothetical protein
VIDVARDTEGLKMAFAEIFEQDFDRARIAHSAESATEETRERLLASIAPLKLSPGYHRFAYHLMQLESMQSAGVVFHAGELLQVEGAGLVCLKQARSAFSYKHPPCSACGTLQDNRFGTQCVSCGVKFQRRKK